MMRGSGAGVCVAPPLLPLLSFLVFSILLLFSSSLALSPSPSHSPSPSPHPPPNLADRRLLPPDPLQRKEASEGFGEGCWSGSEDGDGREW